MIKKLFNDYVQRLLIRYPKQEAESLILWLFEHYLGLNRMDIHQGKDIPNIPNSLETAFLKLLKGVPIQYITQLAPFYGRDFIVSPSVLIPRNETEELVHMIIQENKQHGLRIMDVGTGSGCIAVTLALDMDRPKVFALDVSASALEVAKRNLARFAADVDLLQVDILKEDLPINSLDILVSNPPYVRASEKTGMHTNVLDHEPHLALFVPDKDPLIFYREIAKKGRKALNPGGKLYFEINQALGDQMVDLLSEMGYQAIRLHEDLNGRSRMVSAVK